MCRYSMNKTLALHSGAAVAVFELQEAMCNYVSTTHSCLVNGDITVSWTRQVLLEFTFHFLNLLNELLTLLEQLLNPQTVNKLH